MHYTRRPIATSLTIASRLTVFKILVSQILSPQFLRVFFYVLLGAIRVHEILVPALAFGIGLELVFIRVQGLKEVLVGLTLRSKFSHVLILLLLLDRVNVSVRHIGDFSLRKSGGGLPRLFFLRKSDREFRCWFNY